MPTGCERSVLLMFAALSLFCIFRVCAGQLHLVLIREGPERNAIRLTCFNDDLFEVQNATFYMRAPGAVTRMRVNETGNGLQDFRRDGSAIVFTITPEIEANFTCARPASENETSGLLVAAFRPVQNYIPQFLTVFPGETIELECGIQPGQARELYSVEWRLNNQVLNNQIDFSLSVSVERMSQNGSVYQCSVTITSCSPISTGCSSASRTVDGNSITLIVEDPYPRIVTPPLPVVTAVADGDQHNTTFNCTAFGGPIPHISWMHNMQNVSQNGRFQVMVTEDGRNRMSSSTLTINSLTATDSGIIQCVADNSLGVDSADTTLSVLTDDFQLEVDVTAEGNLMLTVTLQTAIPGPVRLRIKYTWVVQPDTVERTTNTTFENEREIVHTVFRSEVPFQQFRFQVALQVDRVIGPCVPELENATVITLPPAQDSGLITALSVLVPFSVLLVLIISLTVPAVIFKMRKKKVETIQDYASTAIELLSKGNPIQLPPQPPPHPPPHLPRQYPQQCPPRLPSHDNTIIISESSSINDGHSQTHPEDLEHHRGSQSVSINTGKQNKSETLPTSTQSSHPITRTDTPSQPSQPSHPITRTDTPSQPLQPTTRTDTPSQPSRNGNVDHLIADWMPTETSRKEMSSKDNVSKRASSNGEQNMVGTGYERIATYETVGNVYDKIGTCETITPTSSAAHSTPKTDAPIQEETASKNETSKRASFVNKGGQNMATAASVSNSQESSKSSPPVCASESVGSSEGAKVTDSVHKKTVAPLHHGEGHYEQLGTVYERIATYETVGNVYDKIGTYETIGNVYDKIGTYETITATRSAPHSTPRSDTLTQEESASNDNTSEEASANEGGLNMATTAGVSHFPESSEHSPPACVSGEVGSSEGAKITDLATYETVGNVYDRICTYETIGNVYDNSLVPNLGFHETSLQPFATSID